MLSTLKLAFVLGMLRPVVGVVAAGVSLVHMSARMLSGSGLEALEAEFEGKRQLQRQ